MDSDRYSYDSDDTGREFYTGPSVLGLHPIRAGVALAYAGCVTLGLGVTHPLAVLLLIAYSYGIAHAWAVVRAVWCHLRVSPRGRGADRGQYR